METLERMDNLSRFSMTSRSTVTGIGQVSSLVREKSGMTTSFSTLCYRQERRYAAIFLGGRRNLWLRKVGAKPKR